MLFVELVPLQKTSDEAYKSIIIHCLVVPYDFLAEITRVFFIINAKFIFGRKILEPKSENFVNVKRNLDVSLVDTETETF